MAETTFEEARRCPSCGEPSKEVKVTNLPQGAGQMHVFECDNERCSDKSGRRLVQTNPDGSIPQRRQGPKTFPKINHFADSAQRARDHLRIIEFQSTHPGLTYQEVVRILGG